MSKHVLIAGLLVAGLLVAGCGGNDDGETQTIAKGAFVKQANTICSDTGRKILVSTEAVFREQEKESQAGAVPGESETNRQLAAAMVPALQAEVTELSNLGAPDGDEAQVEAIVNAIRVAIDEYESDPNTIRDAELVTAMRKPADEYGLSRCPLG